MAVPGAQWQNRRVRERAARSRLAQRVQLAQLEQQGQSELRVLWVRLARRSVIGRPPIGLVRAKIATADYFMRFST
jgi:hypothetical protein